MSITGERHGRSGAAARPEAGAASGAQSEAVPGVCTGRVPDGAADLDDAAVAGLLNQTGAHRYGHFRLTTGLHSDEFFLLARAFQYPEVLERLGAALAARLRRVLPAADAGQGGPAGSGPVAGTVGAVVGPAMGGVLLAHAVARVLGGRSLFAEKEADGSMRLKRGFALAPGEPVVVVEDAVTTGGSVRKTMEAVARAGGRVVAVGAVVDRSGGKADFGVPFVSLLCRDVAAFVPEECPLCRRGVPLVEPKRG
ncbi:MAG: orotate phosphoribosyltransferase [Bacillota bacterium]|nr:MAG: orotate phosphoribosyltransferase [Bacillota bacterium]